ncbi:unnamed protein product [Orchesella dallaii]|uniref:ABC transporter domain-containing protein n=1 Tax=Orchesella dallaii TaxID=48710 RepID=A0ABP1QYA4_9HEXA
MKSSKAPPPLIPPKMGSGDTELMMGDHSDVWTTHCDLSFRKICSVPIKGGPFSLENVSGYANAGQILAIMGPSGSGKTTLLSSLSGRTRLKTGCVYINGEVISKKAQRTRLGYVMQNDIFFPTLTLRQTLIYTAFLRLSDKKYLTSADKLKKVDDIIETLELYQCQNSVVGNDVNRGLSGGEKKRLSVACELITDPSILLIDEPTSGLDSCTAGYLINTLKQYAQKSSKTIIMTVHQPSSKMYQMFDSLLLLSNGKTAYFGPSHEVLPHFASLGMHLEAHYNPAEFLLEKMKSDEQKLLQKWEETQNQNRCCQLDANEDWETTSTDSIFDSWHTSFGTQVRVLAERNIQLAKPRIFSKINVIQTIILALMSGFVWFRTPRSEASLTDLEGWMFFSSNYWMLFVLFQALWSLPSERAMINKERRAGAYRFSSYFVAKLVEAPLEVILPCLYLIICYPMVGGQTLTGFVGLMFNQILSSLAAQSIGIFLGSVLEPSTATTAAAIFTVAAQLLGGYLTNNIPTYLKVSSLVYNGLRNMQIIEFFFGVPITCGIPSQLLSCSNNVTGYIDPVDILERHTTGFSFPYWSNSAVLVAFVLVFRILTFFVLRKVL